MDSTLFKVPTFKTSQTVTKPCQVYIKNITFQCHRNGYKSNETQTQRGFLQNTGNQNQRLILTNAGGYPCETHDSYKVWHATTLGFNQ